MFTLQNRFSSSHSLAAVTPLKLNLLQVREGQDCFFLPGEYAAVPISHSSSHIYTVTVREFNVAVDLRRMNNGIC